MNERIPDGLRELLAHAAGAGHAPWGTLLKPGDWLLLLAAAVAVSARPIRCCGVAARRTGRSSSWMANW
jgi:hypothetical protein